MFSQNGYCAAAGRHQRNPVTGIRQAVNTVPTLKGVGTYTVSRNDAVHNHGIFAVTYALPRDLIRHAQLHVK